MSNAAQAYSRTSHTTAAPREIEAQALLKAARQLQDVQANWTGPDKNMHNALLFNRRLWSISRRARWWSSFPMKPSCAAVPTSTPST